MGYVETAHAGLAALDARNYDLALTDLTTALSSSLNPKWLIARSKALVGLSRFAEALHDADLAYHTAMNRSNRELMTEAQHRRAVAYNRLGELANADACCIYVQWMTEKKSLTGGVDPADAFTDENGLWTATLEDAKKEAQESQFGGAATRDAGMAGAMQQNQGPSAAQWKLSDVLRRQILFKLDQLDGQDPARKRTARVVPPKRDFNRLGQAAESKAKEPMVVEAQKPLVSSAAATAPKDTALRIQDFQSATSMNASVFSKGNDKDTVKVEFGKDWVTIDPLIYPDGSKKSFAAKLAGEVDPEACKYTVMPSKIELSLKKAQSGKWPGLGKTGTIEEMGDFKSPTKSQASAQQTTSAAPVASSAPIESKPEITQDTTKPTQAAQPTASSYPTSSRGGPKNWDKIVDDDDEEEEAGVNDFFKKLYKNATPEQQRAMMKSFTESSGTSLSTDWNDVKGRTVETVPPEGVEAKKWK
ncbi:SGS domain-containing protein [Emericellopsis atlantica]|uniref:SGS domain-containing protein n=1 Tax=Emericellopsis atlantica TaxID=2614577 RepID=A0A9P7ZHR7_9HYPO|nr:SGS domain-containing protein [Emericellopsis atlantica]KAG9252250.1 SGS domain-containing protein [Emericellopsis atlantica]